MLDNDKSLELLILEVKASLLLQTVGRTHLGRMALPPMPITAKALPAAECGGTMTIPPSKEVTL